MYSFSGLFVNKYGLKWAGNVRSPDEVPLRMLRLTRVAAIAALLPCRSRKSGADVWASACPGHGGQGLLAAERSSRSKHPPHTAGSQVGGGVFALYLSRRAAAGTGSRFGSGRSGVAPLTRAAAEARMRRGRRDRQRATSWRSAEEGRGRVGGRCERRWPAPAGCRRRGGCGCHRRPFG